MTSHGAERSAIIRKNITRAFGLARAEPVNTPKCDNVQHFIQSLIQYLFLGLLLHISGVLTVHSQLIQAPQLCGQLVSVYTWSTKKICKQ